ncbi:glycosyltransferase [Candidatus Gracilibacteria bacterium]|nr:glycosyltransferase [Candidatus Gracilibacteria bacterium]
MKIAIIHEMLVKLGGAENVAEDLLKIFPEADFFTLIYDKKIAESRFPKSRIKKIPSITQLIYNITGKQYLCLPFMKYAIESLDLGEYDLVISSSSGFAHGCITKPETLHVVYYHTPARFLWDWTHNYAKEMRGKKTIKSILFHIANFTILKALFSSLRKWDYIAGQRNDIAIAASNQVKDRIKKYYRRNSVVIYPPVNIKEFDIGDKPLNERKYYMMTSILTAFKRVDLAIRAFNDLGYELIVIGNGDQLNYLKSIAKENIKFLGFLGHLEQNEYYKNCRGAIMPGRDDFGIIPVEAMSAGVPMFGLRAGGLTETSIEGLTGEFFDYDDINEFKRKFEIFHKNIENKKYDRIKIRDHTKKFNKDRFIEEIKTLINKAFSLN